MNEVIGVKTWMVKYASKTQGQALNASRLEDFETLDEAGRHAYFMGLALEEAKKAALEGEVPIGAVAVYLDRVVGRGHNRRELSLDATSHAEIEAIREANSTLGRWRLTDVDLYVTLEPCPMCCGAMIQSRLRHCYYGAADPKAGCCKSLMHLLDDTRFNHQVSLTAGIREEECREILQTFFRQLRVRNRNRQA